jgi:hypothetical protein
LNLAVVLFFFCKFNEILRILKCPITLIKYLKSYTSDLIYPINCYISWQKEKKKSHVRSEKSNPSLVQAWWSSLHNITIIILRISVGMQFGTYIEPKFDEKTHQIHKAATCSRFTSSFFLRLHRAINVWGPIYRILDN